MTFEQWFRNEVSDGRLYGADEEIAAVAWQAAELQALERALATLERFGKVTSAELIRAMIEQSASKEKQGK